MPFDKRLLKSPVMRAAYSDRTSWLMARLSKAAYIKFDLLDDKINQAAKRIAELNGEQDKIKTELNEFKEIVRELSTQGKNELVKKLSDFGFELVAVFDVKGTQAYLAKREKDMTAVLAFRGTEKDPRDIRTDFDATLIEVNGAKVHKGFYNAYKLVESTILSELEKLKGYTLYITGHSLGGALAIIASCRINSDIVGACYTFGSPKVGNYAYAEKVKVPMYRVVNSADCVPETPPFYYVVHLLILIFKFLARFVPFIGKTIVRFLQNVKGYVEYGDMRYLMDCDEADYSDVILLQNPDVFTKLGNFIKRIRKNIKAPLGDHSLDIYVAKLEQYALKRLI